MIGREDLPEDAADWTKVKVTFPLLSDNSAESCPYSENQVFEYVQIESADTGSAERGRLQFCRTAQVGKTNYWLWEYTESDGEVCYVVFSQTEDGDTCLGLSESNGLSHEQFMLADFYDEVYWP